MNAVLKAATDYLVRHSDRKHTALATLEQHHRQIADAIGLISQQLTRVDQPTAASPRRITE